MCLGGDNALDDDDDLDDDQVAAECLCYHLSRVNLAEAVPHPEKVKEYLAKIIDAFCTAYTEDDIACMNLIIEFIRDLEADPEYSS